MKLSIGVVTLTSAAIRGGVLASPARDEFIPESLPEIMILMDKAFPKWKINEDMSRNETKPCSVDSCEWNPAYLTARYDSLHPDFGGFPTSNDIQHWFQASSQFLGQPYAGTNRHCPLDAHYDVTDKDCPKVHTLDDDGPDGPGLIDAHIALATTTWAVRDKLLSMSDMFDYDRFGCKITPMALFNIVRNYFPRTPGKKVDYPKPYSKEGGDYKYEFPGGKGLANQTRPYLPGPPHWCTEEYLKTGITANFCPYIHEGPDAGGYRRPHIAFAALEVYLANFAMPDKCATTWLENNPDYLSETRVNTNMPFPNMTNDHADPKTVENWIGQPVLPFTWDVGPAKDAKVMLANVTRTYLNFESNAVASGAVTAATGSAIALIGCVIALVCV